MCMSTTYTLSTHTESDMVTRAEIEFEVDGGVMLRGWLFVPSGAARRYPAITMGHGYAAVKDHGIEPFAKLFAENGFVVLLDRKSTRLNSSHSQISYAVFCLKK